MFKNMELTTELYTAVGVPLAVLLTISALTFAQAGAPSLRSKGGGWINGAMTLRPTNAFQSKVRPPPFGRTRRMGHPSHVVRVTRHDSAPFPKFAWNMKLNVVQARQWLTDIAATGAAEGLDGGFDEAEKTMCIEGQQLQALVLQECELNPGVKWALETAHCAPSCADCEEAQRAYCYRYTIMAAHRRVQKKHLNERLCGYERDGVSKNVRPIYEDEYRQLPQCVLDTLGTGRLAEYEGKTFALTLPQLWGGA